MWNVQCNRKYLLILHKNVTGQQRSCKVNISVRRTGTGTKIKLKIQINWKKVISRSIDHSGKKINVEIINICSTAEYYRPSQPSDWQYSLLDGINYFLLRCFYQSFAVK